MSFAMNQGGFQMKMRAIRTLLLVLTVAVVLGATSLQATPIVIDFGTGGASPSGVVQSDGVNAYGAFIPLKTMTVSGTPSHDGVYALDAQLFFDTGIAANYIQIAGTANSVFSTELLKGTFSAKALFYDPTGGLLGVTGLGLDKKD